MIASIPTTIVMRTFGTGKQVPFVFPTSSECVVLPAFFTQEAAAKFCATAGAEAFHPACLTLEELADHLQKWMETEPFDGVKLLAMNVHGLVPPRFRAANMADVVAAVARGENVVQTSIFDFMDAALERAKGAP